MKETKISKGVKQTLKYKLAVAFFIVLVFGICFTFVFGVI